MVRSCLGTAEVSFLIISVPPLFVKHYFLIFQIYLIPLFFLPSIPSAIYFLRIKSVFSGKTQEGIRKTEKAQIPAEFFQKIKEKTIDKMGPFGYNKEAVYGGAEISVDHMAA